MIFSLEAWPWAFGDITGFHPLPHFCEALFGCVCAINPYLAKFVAVL